MAGGPLWPLAWAPPVATLTRVVTVPMRTKTSLRALVSPATRLVAEGRKATAVPSSGIAACVDGPLACAPALVRLRSSVVRAGAAEAAPGHAAGTAASTAARHAE